VNGPHRDRRNALVLTFFQGRNSTWGGFTIGLLVGVVIAIVSALLGYGFHWSTVGKTGVIAVIIGLVMDGLALVAARRRR
jgi:hypothetical protein